MVDSDLQPNGLLWRIHTDGSVWASWSAWDQLEAESPLFVETVEDREVARVTEDDVE